MQPEIIFEEHSGKDGQIGIITLNRPAALNALTLAMCTKLAHQLDEWAQQPAIKAVVIQGAGERAFCAGGDIRTLYHLLPHDLVAAKRFFWQEYRADWQVFHFPKPYIALLQGIVMGGGVGISVSGSHRLVTEDLAWAMPETGIGFLPDVGASYFLARCPDNTGLYLGLTGARLEAADALALGLADAVMPRNCLSDFLEALLATPLGDNPHAVITQLAQRFAIPAPPPALQTPQRAIIQECFAADSVAAIIAALQQHSHPWAQQVAATLLSRSPTSLKVTYRALHTGAKLPFDDCLRMEYRLASRLLSRPDFVTGVRAAVIDKNQSPVWLPPSLAAVSDAELDELFSPLPEEQQLLETA